MIDSTVRKFLPNYCAVKTEDNFVLGDFMNPKASAILRRIVIVPAIAFFASVMGAITASWWAAVLLGFVGVFAFTAFSERILLQMVLGKVGKDPMTWYFVHMVGETLAVVALAVGLGLAFGVGIGGTLLFSAFAFVTWLYVSWENTSRFFSLLPLWLATRF
ncbi:MAG: hypothetical protein IT343_20005 [Candidatus Melainabacteria bacterium]|nr:hypothetical protein [Candidatus Melainabacteria bacterium]